MRHLFTVEAGGNQETLAERIKQINGSGKIALVHSPTDHARESVSDLMNILSVTILETADYLEVGDGASQHIKSKNTSQMYGILRPYHRGELSDTETVIVVAENWQTGPGSFLAKYYSLMLNQFVDLQELKKGQAGHIDFKEGTYQIIP